MSQSFIGIAIAILIWPASLATAQSTSFHGPIAGFVYSRTAGTIRPLLGVPGATHIGPSVLNEVDFASIGPDGKWALINRAGRSSFVYGLADLTPVESLADGLIDTVDRVLWNRDGSFALLYSSAANRLQRVRLSDAGAAADTPMDLSPWGPVAALAIDPAGWQIAFGVAGSGLYLFEAGQSPILLSSMAQPAAAAFDGTGRRLYAVDLDQRRISEFDAGSSVLQFALTTQPDSPAVEPVGLAVSGDGLYLLLADSAARSVWVYDTSSGSLVNAIPLDFSPSRFEALSPAPSFLLNGDNTSEWLLILDARQSPGVSFIPANTGEAQ